MWNKDQKFDFLNQHQHIGNSITWKTLVPDSRYTWLTTGLHAEFDTFIPLGSKEAKAVKTTESDVIFKTYSNGVKTNRDAWAYNFNRNALTDTMCRMVRNYNAEVARWTQQTNRDGSIDDFVVSDDTKIKWSRDLKVKLKRGVIAEYAEDKIRGSLYRPFTKLNLYFDRTMKRCSIHISIHLSHIRDGN